MNKNKITKNLLRKNSNMMMILISVIIITQRIHHETDISYIHIL